MASTGSGYSRAGLIACALLVAVHFAGTNGIDIFLEWNVALDTTLQPVSRDQPVWIA